jgi:hypothetical protein
MELGAATGARTGSRERGPGPRDGQATLIGYSDGRVDVRAWRGESTAPHWVSFARQNLPLIVDGGRVNPQLNDSAEWGATLGNAVLVWR